MHQVRIYMNLCYSEANSFGIVMEFFAKGDLRSYLHLMKPEDDIDKGTLYQFLHFGIDIARGMNYLLKKQVGEIVGKINWVKYIDILNSFDLQQGHLDIQTRQIVLEN